MQKVTIYKGSKKWFKKEIENVQNPVQYTHLINKIDFENKILRVVNNGDDVIQNTKEKVENLIIHLDNYAFVIEQALFNIIFFLDSYQVDNLHLHNPPQFLEDILRSEYQNLVEIKEEKYQYFTKEQFQELSQSIKENILGQDNAIDTILTHIAYTMQKSFTKPLVLLLYGSSGVGKTETAQLLAKTLGESLFRKQMSMGHSNEVLTYFFGGKYNEKCFAKDLLERESNIILLDEFDKVNKILYNNFYQLFDEGELVDNNNNYSVKLGKSIIICTSNFHSEDAIKKELGEAIFSRFDDVIQFQDLSVDVLRKLIDKEINEEFSKLEESQKSRIKKEDILLKFQNLSDNEVKNMFKNVRKIKQYVRYIFAVEIRNILIVN